jgi:autotransporter translocation and assembly factor TamB
VIFRIGRRLAFSALAFFAFVGFVSVPLGNKSGFEHLKAIASTPEAAQAIGEVKSRLLSTQSQVTRWLISLVTHDRDSQVLPGSSTQSEESHERAPHQHKIHIESHASPKPTPPQLTP